MTTTVPGFGDRFPKLLLVGPGAVAEPRLLRALHLAGVAALPGDREASGQKLFGARIVDDPADGWNELGPWVRAAVTFGADAWTAMQAVLSLSGPDYAPGASTVSAGDRPVTVLACPDLDDAALTDAALAGALAAAQRAAGLAWGCGGRA
ncbi:hypothetical protein ACFWPA_04820 [Rhodococcus sp. NPDC058505]|uniref:hypothetical protein n=1 Tax=unclassified Rhodococcus (in: high G+C Gram-positive bacteria) TaxID=192944 RepID=UPI003665CF31